MRDSSDAEFFEDFGDPGMTDVELDALLERARDSGDHQVRVLVKQHLALRRALRGLLADLAAAPDAAAVRTGIWARLAEFLAGSEPPSAASGEAAT